MTVGEEQCNWCGDIGYMRYMGNDDGDDHYICKDCYYLEGFGGEYDFPGGAL